MNEPSPLYKAILQALDVHPDSIVASAWGRDYTLGDFDRMTRSQLRVAAYKIKTYGLWLKLKLQLARIQVWFWRNVDEFVTGLKM